VVTTYIAPMMLEFMKYQNVKLSKMGLLEPYYHFVQYVAENSITFHILYGAIPIGLYLLMRSKGVVHFFTNWGVIAKLKEVNDMLLLWSQFHLLLMANMNLELAVKKVSAASDSVRFKLAFNGMGRNLADGKSISQSIMNSDFPDQVRLMLSGAAENDLQTGVSDLLEVLSIDQSVLFDQMEMLATAISKVIGVLVIGGLFLIILLPLLMIYKGMAH
jgi:type II secretory pathway component PulF